MPPVFFCEQSIEDGDACFKVHKTYLYSLYRQRKSAYNNNMTKKKLAIFKLIIAIVVSELAGVIGAFFTTPVIKSGWYATLAKPALNPPSWVFGPIWTMLYALMGIALWLVWTKTDADRKTKQRAFVFFFAQLGLNALWSIIFFGQQSPGTAFREIIALWILILITIRYFARVSRPAAWLLVPYILWVTFALYLNFVIWRLN